MKKAALAFAVTSALVVFDAQAQATESWLPEDLRATIGVRAWRTDWSSWFDPNQGSYYSADVATTVIPVASLRYQSFLISGSYMVEKDFVFKPLFGSGPGLTVSRKEYDLNLGYFFMPSVAIGIGYKHIEYFAGGYQWEAKGPTLGISGSAPVAPWASLYGNLAVGRLKMTDTDAFNGARGNYLLTELGLALPLGQLSPSMNGFVMTAGYRYQKLGATPNSSAGYPNRDLYEYTQGPVLGLSYTF